MVCKGDVAGVVGSSAGDRNHMVERCRIFLGEPSPTNVARLLPFPKPSLVLGSKDPDNTNGRGAVFMASCFLRGAPTIRDGIFALGYLIFFGLFIFFPMARVAFCNALDACGIGDESFSGVPALAWIPRVMG